MSSSSYRFTLPTNPVGRSLLGAGCVLIGSLSVQLSAAFASTLFDTVGTLGVSGLRMLIAATLLLLIVRPTFRGHSPRAWFAVALYGVAMALMNVMFYGAVSHLPLGIAVTLEFLGPLVVAASTSRRWQLALPAVTLVGVVLIAQPSGVVPPIGIAYGLGAAAAFGSYTVLADRVGSSIDGLDGLALSVTCGAVALLPLSISAAPAVPLAGWAVLAVSATLGVAVAFSLDFLAVRLTSTRAVGTLFAMDPAVGAIVGAIVLGQALSAPVLAGIALVVLSGSAVIWLAGTQSKTARETTAS